MISIGIDVSKQKSTYCILNQYGEVLRTPKEFSHTGTDLKELSRQIKSYGGKDDVRVIMESTGTYNRPVLYYLLDEGDNVKRKSAKNAVLKCASYAGYFFATIASILSLVR